MSQMITEVLLPFVTILAQNNAQPPAWLVLAGGLLASGVVTAILNFWFNRRKTSSETEKLDADAADIIQRAAGELIVRIQEQASIAEAHAKAENIRLAEQNRTLLYDMNILREQTDKIPVLETEIKELKVAVKMLTEQLIEHDIDPVYLPKDRSHSSL